MPDRQMGALAAWSGDHLGELGAVAHTHFAASILLHQQLLML